MEGRDEPMEKDDTQQTRRTGPGALERWRAFAVTVELLAEGWRLLRELLGGVPW
jgi:hypothetical protein